MRAKDKKKIEKENSIVAQGTKVVMMSLEDATKKAFEDKDEAALMEWTYNATLTSATEFTLAVDEVLHQTFGFDDKKIDKFHDSMRDILTALGQVHSYGNHPMTPKDMAVVGEIAKAKYPYEKQRVLIKKLGIAIPTEFNSKLIETGEALGKPLIAQAKKQKAKSKKE